MNWRWTSVLCLTRDLKTKWTPLRRSWRRTSVLCQRQCGALARQRWFWLSSTLKARTLRLSMELQKRAVRLSSALDVCRVRSTRQQCRCRVHSTANESVECTRQDSKGSPQRYSGARQIAPIGMHLSSAMYSNSLIVSSAHTLILICARAQHPII